MNRSTCQKCGKKRYQDRMKMINPKSLKNGKPEWACLSCIDPKYVQVSAEPILFPNSARHFNGVLIEGTNCGICHHAHGREVCDECKTHILDCSKYGIKEIDALNHKLKITEDSWEFYKKHPLNLNVGIEDYNNQLLKSLELKIEVLKKRIFELHAKDKSYYSKDQHGNVYFLDHKTKEWLIHDGKTTLYSVKMEDDLHKYLNENMYEARH